VALRRRFRSRGGRDLLRGHVRTPSAGSGGRLGGAEPPQDHGPALQETLAKKTLALVERLRALFAHHGLAARIESYSSWFFFHLHNDHPLTALLFYHLRERGIHIQDGFPAS